MGHYVQSALLPDERVRYETRLHWIVYAGGALLVFLGFLLVAGTPLGVLAIIAGALIHTAAMITRSTSEFAVTDKRVIIKVGWLSRRTIEMNLSKIESIDVSQSVFGRMLGYGTIMVVGTGATREPFKQIENPAEFRRAVQAQTPD
jgi:uncharacterized membrane protein YdbT with pleckstrin-like domain